MPDAEVTPCCSWSVSGRFSAPCSSGRRPSPSRTSRSAINSGSFSAPFADHASRGGTASSSLKRLVKSKARWSYQRPLSPPRVGGRRTGMCGARCARLVILLFALSVANDDSPAHDGGCDRAAAPSGLRLSTSAKNSLALTAHSPRLTAVSMVAQGEPPRVTHMVPVGRRDRTVRIEVDSCPPVVRWPRGRAGS